MKLVYAILTFAVVLASTEPKVIIFSGHGDNFGIEVLKRVDINKLVDHFSPYITQYIVKNGLDPLELPRAVIDFSLLIFKASLTLQSGTLKHLSHVARDGDATLTYEDKIATLEAGIKFQALQGAYDYALRMLFLAQDGRITALAEDVHAKISVAFNTMDYTLALNNLELQAAGRISVNLQSDNGWIDWIVKSIINVVIPLFKNTITKTVQVETANAIRTFFDEINKVPLEERIRFFENELSKLT